ncbi:hypothetical protein ACVWZA_003816 [Sphingomonas sp. UYAg733]
MSMSLLTIIPLLLAGSAPTDSAGSAAIQTDRAGNRIEAFAAIKPQPGDKVAGKKVVDEASASASALHCTADRKYCAQLSRDVDANVWTLHVFDRLPAPDGAVPVASFAIPDESGDARVAIWPHIVVEASAGARVLIGVETTASTSYSGGGASATMLQLIALNSAAGMKPVLSVPSGGWAMIRACFSEADMAKRAGACHDEYAFDGDLTLDPAVASGPPRFLFTTSAKSFPGRVSRQADSLAAAPLRKKDVKWAVDPLCSYRRTLSFDAATGSYALDNPLPTCDDYLVP